MNFFVIMPTDSNIQYCAESRSWVRKSKGINASEKNNDGQILDKQSENTRHDVVCGSGLVGEFSQNIKK